MGRMFRIITEGGHEPSHSTAETIERETHSTMNPSTLNPFANESVPFVEVGGPEGVVTSYSRSVHTVHTPPQQRVVTMPIPHPVTRVVSMPIPMPEPERYVQAPVRHPEPRPAVASEARVLSVAFHKFPKPGLRILPTGIAAEVVTYHYPDHPISAEYRLVREEIRRQFDTHAQRTVVFTAANLAAGTTTVLLNVAVAMAQENGARVLVVDTNITRPAVAARMGAGDTPGLAEVLNQSVPLAWAIQTTAVQGLHVLATGVGTEKTLATMGVELPRLLAQVRQWFDWVLVDVGVWDHTIGRDVLSSASDAVYLVTRQNDIERMEYNHLRAAIGSNLRGYITTRQ